MGFDTIIYAVIAVAILARLWSVLGRRNEGDAQRPNPFVTPAPGPQDDLQKNPQAIGSGVKDILAADAANPLLLLSPSKSAPSSLAGGLEQIKRLDPSFNEKSFLTGARSAFTMIVENFGKGDLTGISRLLGPRVLPHFEAAIEARRKAGQSMTSRVTLIKEADIAAVKVDGKQVSITVHFVSEQSNILRDSAGHVIGGAEGAIEEITDLWTFTRDTASSDPNWILTETHS